jgi:hypothetical protein
VAAGDGESAVEGGGVMGAFPVIAAGFDAIMGSKSDEVVNVQDKEVEVAEVAKTLSDTSLESQQVTNDNLVRDDPDTEVSQEPTAAVVDESQQSLPERLKLKIDFGSETIEPLNDENLKSSVPTPAVEPTSVRPPTAPANADAAKKEQDWINVRKGIQFDRIDTEQARLAKAICSINSSHVATERYWMSLRRYSMMVMES